MPRVRAFFACRWRALFLSLWFSAWRERNQKELVLALSCLEFGLQGKYQRKLSFCFFLLPAIYKSFLLHLSFNSNALAIEYPFPWKLLSLDLSWPQNNSLCPAASLFCPSSMLSLDSFIGSARSGWCGESTHVDIKDVSVSKTEMWVFHFVLNCSVDK